MLKFKFAGSFRRHFREIVLNVKTPAQGLRLLMAQNFGFKKAIMNTPLKIRVNGHQLTNEDAAWHMDREPPEGATVLFVPVVAGSGLEPVSWIAIAAAVMAAAAVGYSIYMAHNMKAKNASENREAGTLDNNSFSSAENRVGQGKPVPILLGEMVVGSNVISLGIDTSNNQNWAESIS